MMDSLDLGERDDLSEISVVGRPWIGRILLERQVRPGAIAVPAPKLVKRSAIGQRLDRAGPAGWLRGPPVGQAPEDRRPVPHLVGALEAGVGHERWGSSLPSRGSGSYTR